MDQHRVYLALIERLVREGRNEWEIDRIVRQAVREDREVRPRRLPRFGRGERRGPRRSA